MTLKEIYELPNGTKVCGWFDTIWEKTDNFLECITPGKDSGIKVGEYKAIFSFKKAEKQAKFRLI